MSAATTFVDPQWAEASAVVEAAQTILIVTHVRPDGDAIGSALGLARALRDLGKSVTVANDDLVPDYLQWLLAEDEAGFVQELDGSFDLMISTDSSDEERTGQVGVYGREHSERVVNLDHHVTNTGFGDVHLVVATAVSATEIVVDWLDHLGIAWTKDIATPLLTGLVTDTLGFRTSNVSTRTLSVAQKLMQAGSSLSEVTARALEHRAYQDVALWKRALPSVQLHGEVVEATVKLADLEAAGIDEPTDGGLVGFLRGINEAMIAIVFKEESAEEVKISMRAKPGYDVASVALSLGGGGHAQAAGATVAGSIDDVRAQVLPLLQQAVAEGQLKIE